MTPKQQAFVREYLIDLNATQAAIRAGYSSRLINTNVTKLLQNTTVAAAIQEEQQKRAEQTGITAEWVLKTLAAEKTADLSELYDDEGRLRPVAEWPEVWRQGLVVGVESVEEYQTIDGVRQKTGLVRKLKLSDRVKHLELIGRHVRIGAWRDKLEHSGTLIAASIQLSPEERAAALNRIMAEY